MHVSDIAAEAGVPAGELGALLSVNSRTVFALKKS
jgi:hypothetical protein